MMVDIIIFYFYISGICVRVLSVLWSFSYTKTKFASLEMCVKRVSIYGHNQLAEQLSQVSLKICKHPM